MSTFALYDLLEPQISYRFLELFVPADGLVEVRTVVYPKPSHHVVKQQRVLRMLKLERFKHSDGFSDLTTGSRGEG